MAYRLARIPMTLNEFEGHFVVTTRVKKRVNAPTRQFNHPMFNRSELIVLTNQQIHKHKDSA